MSTQIVSWNVNGIRAVEKKGLFAPMLAQLKPDILCLQETKAQPHESPVVVPGYYEYWNSAEKKGYSGTAIFSREKPLEVLNDLPGHIAEAFGVTRDTFGDPNREGRVIAAEFDDFYVVNVYTPNSKGDLTRLMLRKKHWDPAFLAFCDELNARKPVIFCGDLNVAHTPDDLANPKQNEGTHGYTAEERAGVDAMIEHEYHDTFRMFTKGNGHYSWWSHFANSRARNIGWRLDYVFVSESLVPRVTEAHIHAGIHGSDHCPISTKIK